MLKIKVVPLILKIISKIDLKPVTEAVKSINDFTPTNDKTEAAAQLAERKTELGFSVLEAITPQLGRIADDITELIAAYEGVTVDAAAELDAIAEFKKIAADAGMVSFFKSALQTKGSGRK